MSGTHGIRAGFQRWMIGPSGTIRRRSGKEARDLSKKKKKRIRGKKKKPSNVQKLPVRRSRGTQDNKEQKLSEIIKEMALRLLKAPDDIPSAPASEAVLLLASAAWNVAVGDTLLRTQHREVMEGIDWRGVKPWVELRSDDTDELIAELVDHKRERYPNDSRRIVATEMSPEGNVRVHWVEQEKVVTAQFGSTGSQAKDARKKRGRPIAEKIVRKMKKKARGKVIDLEEVKAGRANAEELQKSVVGRDALSQYHPAHAAYVYTQNQVSVMSEQLTALDEMARFDKIISRADDEYMPNGPPMSPLTTSFFTCWAFFDACVGLAEETIGTTAMAVGAAFGMHAEMVRMFGLMQQSRMGIYINEGTEGALVVLREFVTDTVCRAVVPTGYRGRRGELWYVRVLPPPLPETSEHVVFTTPYILLKPGPSEWQAYFRRTLPDAPMQARVEAYERHMKFGPTRSYWSEFVFEAYVNHRTEVIFLAGLPDVPESRPHSEVNSR